MHEFLTRLLTDQLTLEERLVFASQHKPRPSSDPQYHCYVPRLFELLRHTGAAHLKRDIYLALENILPETIPNHQVLLLVKEVEGGFNVQLALNLLLKIQIPRHINLDPIKIIAGGDDVNRHLAILVFRNVHWREGEPFLLQLCRDCQENPEDMLETIQSICQALESIGTANSLSVLLALKQSISAKQTQQDIEKTIRRIQTKYSQIDSAPAPEQVKIR